MEDTPMYTTFKFNLKLLQNLTSSLLKQINNYTLTEQSNENIVQIIIANVRLISCIVPVYIIIVKMAHKLFK